MDQKLVASIISHHSDRLESISIDNVQHWGLESDGTTPLTCGHSLQLRWRLMEEDLYPHGPIRGILNASMHYPNLKHLYLRKAGWREVGEHEWVPEADIEVYKEWATFISSVRAQIKSLTFEQAARPYARRPSPNQSRRPMGSNFHDFLLPVFLQGGWKELEVLKIYEVGRWQREDPVVMNDSTRAAIADAVGPNVKLIIEEKPCRPANLWTPPAY